MPRFPRSVASRTRSLPASASLLAAAAAAMEVVADEHFLDFEESYGGEASYFSFSEDFEEELECPQLLTPFPADFDSETLASTPGSPFAYDSDAELHGIPPSPPFWDCLEDDDGFEWEEISDAAPVTIDVTDVEPTAMAAAGGGGSGGRGGGGTAGGVPGDGGVDADVFGLIDEREILGAMEGINSGNESGFSDELPFDFDNGQEIDDMFRSVGWEVLAVPLDEDEFEVLPGHVTDVAVGGAPPAARAAVERLQVVQIGGEEASQGCAVCKDGIEQGELVTRLPCAHFYHGACIGPWLAIRNSCPVCRYELPTDDPAYELRRARRRSAAGSTSQSSAPMEI